ncbi:hypothetical protein [Novosphingobium naphthalenivorans]|uniref:hypothetical protein n=1 Tax=Novosphingobium naphthalenivorans TaxID=273168 RepID=UPI00082F84BB|nr:hypothetical protein [Novosphingobium naphthalenivorans]
MMDDDDEELLDFDSAYRIASLIVEACDRVKPMHAIAPGAVATTAIEIDDIKFRIQISCEGPA